MRRIRAAMAVCNEYFLACKASQRRVCKKQNSSTKARTSTKRSRALKNGKGAGKERFSPMQYLQAEMQDLFSIFRLPLAQRRRLRTTKVIGRLFVEVY
jgi:hypothetical protein